MKDLKHTKGQWSNIGLEIRSQSGMILANVYKHLPLNQPTEEAEANAKLISAAPELLEALTLLVDLIPENTKDDAKWHIRNKAMEAIKKATE